MPNEPDTCRRLVVPKLQFAGWDNEPFRINEQVTFTDGRIVVTGQRGRRRPGKRADYVLRYRPDFPIAVVEAKASDSSPGEGLQQAKDYAILLGLSFAFSTNGHEILEFDLITGTERQISSFPTPDELWTRLNRKAQLDSAKTEKLLTPAYHLSGKSPRYYQEIAINRTVQAVNLVDGIHFDASEEIHTLARLYEAMLREMRDAAGDSGEFYTPRPVIQFMVTVTNPQLGEVVLDPACGTGGFLAESFSHLEKHCKTVQDRKVLQDRSIAGGEAKPLPYMLAQMNLLLHGLDAPAIEYGNSLAVKITELGPSDQVDVILTNPPFGGEEEAGIRNNFPAAKQTSETALLFLQLIMRRLKKPRSGNENGGRAAIVVPNGTLFGDGVCARIKEDLLKEFNLHTIVRLPNGVFAPYTAIPTNLLFFDRSGPTKDIWFYELPMPDGRKNYSKTKPVQFDEFADCIQWFQSKRRKEDDHAWKVPAKNVLKYDKAGNLLACNLDQKNPSSADALVHLPPEQLADDILAKERRIIEIMEEIKAELAAGGSQ